MFNFYVIVSFILAVNRFYRMANAVIENGDGAWTDIQSGLRDVFDRNPMAPKRYMELYSYVSPSNNIITDTKSVSRHVFNFCTVAATAPKLGTTGGRNRKNGNMATDFMGIDLYNKLKNFIDQYVCKILEVRFYPLFFLQR